MLLLEYVRTDVSIESQRTRASMRSGLDRRVNAEPAALVKGDFERKRKCVERADDTLAARRDDYDLPSEKVMDGVCVGEVRGGMRRAPSKFAGAKAQTAKHYVRGRPEAAMACDVA